MEDTKRVKLEDIELEFKDVLGAGKQIHAHLGKEFMCVEFTLKAGVAQPIMIAADPWMQFPPLEWNRVVETVFKELVRLFNEKYKYSKGVKPNRQASIEKELDGLDFEVRTATCRQRIHFDKVSRDCKHREMALLYADTDCCTEVRGVSANVINRGQCSIHTCPFIPHLWRKAK